jgi:hypothetical protein
VNEGWRTGAFCLRIERSTLLETSQPGAADQSQRSPAVD